MSDLENMPEEIDLDSQPNEAVAADLEVTKASPQAEDTEEEEFVIEGEGDQEQPNEDEELLKRRAAFAEQKRKKREAEERARQEEARANELQAKLDELEDKVGTLARGEKPDPFNYVDKDEFYAALAEWEKSGKVAPVQSNASAQPEVQSTYQPDDIAEFKFSESSDTLKKRGIKDYDDKIDAVKNALKPYGGNPDAVFNSLLSMANDAGVDAGKAMYMVGRNPEKLLSELDQAGTPIKMAKILERESKKLVTRKKKSVDTAPEADVSTGAVKKKNTLADFGQFE